MKTLYRIVKELNLLYDYQFFLNAAAARLPLHGSAGPLAEKTPQPGLFYRRFPGNPAALATGGDGIAWNEERCFSCGQCLGICPAGVFRRDKEWRISADTKMCTGCGLCDQLCPAGAVSGGRDER